jgi:hypothetical protein
LSYLGHTMSHWFHLLIYSTYVTLSAIVAFWDTHRNLTATDITHRRSLTFT